MAWRRAGEHERKQKGEGGVVWGAQLRRKMGRRIGFRDPIFLKKLILAHQFSFKNGCCTSSSSFKMTVSYLLYIYIYRRPFPT